MSGLRVADQITQRQDKDGMLRRALERIIQLYTDKSHFVYELLQNAEDAGATIIKFIQHENELVVIHDGRPFTMENLQGLCDIGKSDKAGDINQIGEFGVGFKSVFGICETVRLYSYPRGIVDETQMPRFSVEIRDFTQPVDIEHEDFSGPYTTRFVFPFAVGLPFSGFDTMDELRSVLTARLKNIGITTLLFMKNLKYIQYEIDEGEEKSTGTYYLDRQKLSDHITICTSQGEINGQKETSEIDRYMVFSRKIEGLSTEKTIDIAFSAYRDDNGSVEFKVCDHPFVSVYFPTETESKLNFIVQGPFRTTPNRSSVPQDDKDNLNLARMTARLFRDSIIELRNLKLLKISLMNILPFDGEAFDNAPLFYCMHEELMSMFREEAIILCKDGTYAKADQVKIARGDEFSKVFSDEILTELINDGKDYHWLPMNITENSRVFKDLYTFLTNELQVELLRPENIRGYFVNNPEFMTKRDDDWIVRLYQMYTRIAGAFVKKEAGINMLTTKIIKTSQGGFVAAYRKIDESDQQGLLYQEDDNATFVPNVFLPADGDVGMDGITFVDSTVYERCREFFEDTLRLHKPNEYIHFVKDLKERYSRLDAVSDAVHISDVKHLLHYYKMADHRDEVESLIRNYMKLKCTYDGATKYASGHNEQVFFSLNEYGMSIEQYFKNIVAYPYVDLDFYEIEDITRDDLRLFGVLDDISVGADKISGTYAIPGRKGKQPEWSVTGDFRWKLSLEFLDEVLEYICQNPNAPDAKAKSSYILRFLYLNENKLQGLLKISGKTADKPGERAVIVTKLRHDGPKQMYYGSKWDGKWLYTESDELVSQKEISKNELNSIYYGDLSGATKLFDLLGFAKNESEQLEEAEKSFDLLSDEQQKRFFEIALQRMFGISVADLESAYGEHGTGVLSGKMPGKGSGSYEFPSSRVNNWGALKKHTVEILSYADPVKYAQRLRKIRISSRTEEKKAYLRNMYKVYGERKYACQMCHEVFSNLEVCQIEKSKPELELDQMNLYLCPNCHSEFRKIRGRGNSAESFLNRIEMLSDSDIDMRDPVPVSIEDEEIWFTQTHIAEIRELISLQKNAGNPEFKQVVNEEDAKPDTDVYKSYVGKRVRHKTEGYGVIKTCDGERFGILFDEGKKAGTIASYQIEICLSRGLIEVVDG